MVVIKQEDKMNKELKKKWSALKVSFLALSKAGSKLALTARIAAEETRRFSKAWSAIGRGWDYQEASNQESSINT